MKKTIQQLLFAFVALFVLTTVSACDVYIDSEYDRDQVRADVISGEWQGDFGMFYSIANPYTGRAVRFDSYNSNLVFYSDYYGATSGTGKQVDYYDRGPYSARYHAFRWYVQNGVLYLEYYQSANDAGSLDTAIYDYRLSDAEFFGRFGTSASTFRLRKLSNFGWGSYSGSYYDYVADGWQWSSVGYYTQGASAPSADDLATRAQHGAVTTAIASGRRSVQN